jgi:hypothetical protein
MIRGATMLALLAAVARPVAAPTISVEPHMEPPYHSIAVECPWIFGAVSISSATYGATIKAPAGGTTDCSAPVPRDNALAKLQLSCDGLQSCVFETCPCAPPDSTTGPTCKCPQKAACTPPEVRTAPDSADCNIHCMSGVPLPMQNIAFTRVLATKVPTTHQLLVPLLTIALRSTNMAMNVCRCPAGRTQRLAA